MPLSPQESDNLTRWSPNKKPFYEVYYLKWNDPSQDVAAWIRYTLLAPLNREPELSVWGIFFDAKDPLKNQAVKKTYPLREGRIERDFFYFSAGPSAIFDGGARGNISNEGTHMSWELKSREGETLSLKHFPTLLYLGGFPKTKFLAPYLSTRLTGDFTVNDRRISLKDVPAHQAHLWGTQQAASWVWGNCNAFREDSSFCFEGLSARVPAGEKLSPPMTILFFDWEGKMYSFNSPLRWLTNRSAHTLDRWHFEAGTNEIRFVGDVSASPDHMAGVRYEDPDGSERFCHNTKVADIRIQILKKNRSAWESVKTLTAERTCAFEVVGPALDPRVRLMIL